MSPPHLGPKLLMGGAWITYFDVTVSQGYNSSVRVNYDATAYRDTTYTRTTSEQRVEWVDTGLGGGFYITISTSWEVPYSVSTAYTVQTHRFSNQWVDTSYTRNTWRETHW